MSQRVSTPRGADASDWDKEVNLAEVMALLLRGRRTIILLALLGGLAGALVALVPPPRYRASAAFTPQEQGVPDLGGLGALAGQFGVAVPGGGTQNPEFYQELLFGRAIAVPVLQASYQMPAATGETTLVALSEAGGDSEAERLHRALKWFREKALSATVGRTTGVVSFSVETRWPTVSYEAAQRILREIEHFNLETRQSQAEAERTFLEARLTEAEEDLLQTERRLQSFLQENRQFSNSPELQFRHDRLQRQVMLRQQVYTGLVEAYEQARIQEVRNTPVITVVEEPVLPPRREPRRTILKTLVGLLVGTGIGVIAAVLTQTSRAAPDPDKEALARAWSETKADFLRLPMTRPHGRE